MTLMRSLKGLCPLHWCDKHWQRSNSFKLFASTTDQQFLQQKQLKPIYVQKQIQRPSQGNLKLHQQHFPQ